MNSLDDFSTNRNCSDPPPVVSHSDPRQVDTHFNRHFDLCFNDGTVAVLTGSTYFLVHEGVLCRHSIPLASMMELIHSKQQQRHLEGRLVLELLEAADDVYHFLLALYDGISAFKFDVEDFEVASAVLRLATTYQVKHLRGEIIRGLSMAWPNNLAQWEVREARSINSFGFYDPRKWIPHPILVINLARTTEAYELLPAAFYDFSRYPLSDCASDYTCPLTGTVHQLPIVDLIHLLRGKECGSRFLSTFIVSELEGREPTATCIYYLEPDPARRRICQAAFESITFQILHDVNGKIYPDSRGMDPLFTILDAEMMGLKSEMLGVSLNPGLRPCEFCRADFSTVVDAAREELWQRLPSWFGIDPQVWA